jgi:hypothetical protein
MLKLSRRLFEKVCEFDTTIHFRDSGVNLGILGWALSGQIALVFKFVKVHSSFPVFLGNRKKPAKTLAAEVGEHLNGALTIANWEKIEANCFAGFSNLERDQSIGHLRRQFQVVKTKEGRNGILTAEILKCQNAGGDPILEAEAIMNNGTDFNCVDLRDHTPGLHDEGDILGSTDQDDVELQMSVSERGANELAGGELVMAPQRPIGTELPSLHLAPAPANGTMPCPPRLYPTARTAESTLLSFDLEAAAAAKGEDVPQHKKYFSAEASGRGDADWIDQLQRLTEMGLSSDAAMKCISARNDMNDRTMQARNDMNDKTMERGSKIAAELGPDKFDALSRLYIAERYPDQAAQFINAVRTGGADPGVLLGVASSARRIGVDPQPKRKMTIEVVAWAKKNIHLSCGTGKTASTPIVVQALAFTEDSVLLYAIDRMVWTFQQAPQLQPYGVEAHFKALTFVEGGPRKVMFSRIALSKKCMELLINLVKENPDARARPSPLNL